MSGYLRLDAFRATPLVREPFPHLIVSGFVGPQALAAVKSSFHARHSGVAGLSRVSLDILTPNYYRSEESKELGRSFGAKQKPDRSKFYR